MTRRGKNVIPQEWTKRRPRKLEAQWCYFAPRQATEWVLLETIVNQMKQMIGKSYSGFTKHKSWQTKLITLYNIKPCSIDMGRALDGVYLDFSKALDTISHSILLARTDWAVCEMGRKLSHSKGGENGFYSGNPSCCNCGSCRWRLNLKVIKKVIKSLQLKVNHWWIFTGHVERTLQEAVLDSSEGMLICFPLGLHSWSVSEERKPEESLNNVLGTK